MKKWYKIPVTWESYGIIEVEAESLEQAIEEFDREEENYDLPDAQYVDGSFKREDLEIIELNNQK